MRGSSLSSSNAPLQRLRLIFGRGEELKYLSHLDLMRLWHRAFRRAGMPLAYSQGFSPHPRFSLAAPLPVGVTSEGELMDVFLERRVSVDFFSRAMARQLPLGIEILGVREIWPGLPSLQSLVRFAEYRVEIEAELKAREVQEALHRLLEKRELPWQHQRGEEVRRYDLRAQVDGLWLIEGSNLSYALGMRLRQDPSGAGRPEQVTLALGFSQPPKSIHRLRLILGQPTFPGQRARRI